MAGKTRQGWPWRVVASAAMLLLALRGASATRAEESQIYGVREFAVRVAPGLQARPIISGSRVIWQEGGAQVKEIRGRNLTTGQEFMFTTGNYYEDYDLDGEVVVTVESDLDGAKGLFGYRLEAGFSRIEIAPLETGSELRQSWPRISDDIVVWGQGSDTLTGMDIYGHSLETGETFPICTDPAQQERPAISGHIVVWADGRHRRGSDLATFDLYAYDLSAGREFRITSQPEAIGPPAIAGDSVVWWAQRDRAYRIMAYDVSTGEESVVASLGHEPGALDVDVDGHLIVWSAQQRWLFGDHDIHGYDLAQKERFAISRAIGDQLRPRISGHTVVWADTRHRGLGKYDANRDIYAATLTPSAAEVPPITGAPDQVDARIQIVFPHGKPVTEADRANIGTYLVQPGTLKPAPCQWHPEVFLWRAANDEPARIVATAAQRAYAQLWEHNNIDVAAARDPRNRIFFFITVAGTSSRTNVWAHAADARTYFPHQDVPTGVAEPGGAIDAKIEIVWPHGGVPVAQARLANVRANLFKADTLLSVPPEWEPTVRLWRSLNNGVAEEVAVGHKRLVTHGSRTYPVWDFDNVDVSAARDPNNRHYFFLSVDKVQAYSNVWAHAADSRTYFPIWDKLDGDCARVLSVR